MSAYCWHGRKFGMEFNFVLFSIISSGSAKFSRRKIGHAHNNSADSENVAGAREPNVHAHFIFRLENSQGNKSFLILSMPKTQLK